MVAESNFLDNLAATDYESYIKSILAIELGSNSVQLHKLYESYMDDDDFSLINPVFIDLMQEIDWTSLYVTDHLEKLAENPYREQIVSVLQQYFIRKSEDNQFLLSKVVDYWGLSETDKQTLSDLLSSQEDDVLSIRKEYQTMLTEDIDVLSETKFIDLVNAAQARDLLEEKETFLRNYLAEEVATFKQEIKDSSLEI